MLSSHISAAAVCIYYRYEHFLNSLLCSVSKNQVKVAYSHESLIIASYLMSPSNV